MKNKINIGIIIGMLILRIIGIWIINISINYFVPYIPINIFYDLLLAIGILLVTVKFKFNFE